MKTRKFDGLDLKILNVLRKDARTPFVDIAKELNVRPGVVQTRYAKMKKAGLLIRTRIILNRAKMQDLVVVGIGVEAIESDIEQVIAYIYSLKTEDALITCWKTFGRYNISVLMLSKDLIQIHHFKQLLLKNYAVREATIAISSGYKEFPDKFELERFFINNR
jgi:Lrp/AsnC family transcriptional regulator, regulator for asnA, asnC and gidA